MVIVYQLKSASNWLSENFCYAPIQKQKQKQKQKIGEAEQEKWDWTTLLEQWIWIWIIYTTANVMSHKMGKNNNKASEKREKVIQLIFICWIRTFAPLSALLIQINSQKLNEIEEVRSGWIWKIWKIDARKKVRERETKQIKRGVSNNGKTIEVRKN